MASLTGKPLVVLHGGPGATHDYLLALTEFAMLGWQVVHYDQVGNGRSTHLPEPIPSCARGVAPRRYPSAAAG